jgi:Ca2+-transporting ATPase
LNLVVHIFPAMALVLMPGAPDVMMRPPRDPKEPLLPWGVVGGITLRSAFVAGVVLWNYAAGGGHGDGPRGQTLVMATLALTLLVQTLPTLSGTAPFWQMGDSLTAAFWLSLAGGLALQALALYWPPLASVLLVEPLSAADLGRGLGMALLALAAIETGKLLAARGYAPRVGPV